MNTARANGTPGQRADVEAGTQGALDHVRVDEHRGPSLVRLLLEHPGKLLRVLAEDHPVSCLQQIHQLDPVAGGAGHSLGVDVPPAPLGDDLDGAVDDLDGGLVVDGVRRTSQAGRPPHRLVHGVLRHQLMI